MLAKAQLSWEMDDVAPKINDNGVWRLVKARHPLIPAGKVVPVDARLDRNRQSDPEPNQPAHTYEAILAVMQEEDFSRGVWLHYSFRNSNGGAMKRPEYKRGMHLIEVVPSDGSSRFRQYSNRYAWQAYDFLDVRDLFAPGTVFSMETCADAFLQAPLMNNGSTFDYEVEVNFYDPDTQEAIVTVRKIR